jgi:hypothetical protein
MPHASSTPTSERYLAAQVTCHECGWHAIAVRLASLAWTGIAGRPRRCENCDSQLVEAAQWWPLDDPRLIAIAEWRRLQDQIECKEG